jgi:head-tail adaptor
MTGFRTPMAIQKPSTDATKRDKFGHLSTDVETNWTNYITKCFAEDVPQSGVEFHREKAIHADMTHLWKIRGGRLAKGITTDMRLKLLDDPNYVRTMSIVSVAPKDATWDEVHIVAKEDQR